MCASEPCKAGSPRALQLAPPESTKLANGLTLILSPRKGLPVVAANLVIRTGSDANPLDKPGLANFTAAMLDEGTATRSAPQIADQLAQIGASLRTRSTMDATFVEGASLKKNFAQTLELMADVVLHPAFPADEIERRGSRLAQLVQQSEKAKAARGEGHGGGALRRSPSLRVHRARHRRRREGVTRDDLLAFWKQNFVPNNAALVVSGEIVMAERAARREIGVRRVGNGGRHGRCSAPPKRPPRVS